VAIALKGSAVTSGSTGASGAITITHGLTISAGDVLIAFVVTKRNAGTMADNNGDYAFTEDYDWLDTTNSQSHAIYSRVAGSSEPSSYAWATAAWWTYCVILLQFSGVDSDDIWDVPPSDATRDGSWGATATADSQTTTVDGALALFFVQGDGESVSNPTNNFGNGVGQNTADPKSWVCSKSIASAGAIGSTSATLAASAAWRTHLLALTPAPSGVPKQSDHYMRRRVE